MKISFKSIQWRLQIWHGVLLLLVLTAFGFRSYSLARENRFGIIDQDLQHRSILVAVTMPDSSARGDISDAIRAAFIPDIKTPRVSENEIGIKMSSTNAPLERQLESSLQTMSKEGFYYIIWKSDGTILFHSDNLPGKIPIPLADQKPRFHARTRDYLREEFITTANGCRLLVGCPIAADLASLRHVALRLMVAGCIIMAFGLAGGWWLSTRAIRPIKDISAAAEKIASGNFTERINVSDTDGELDRLAKVLNSSFDQLQAALDRQVQFTADASHELRTPLSVMLAKANSALARERTPVEYRGALESCRNATRRMCQLTESLLTLARVDSGEQQDNREPCDLQTLVLEAVEMLRPIADEHGVKCQTELRSGLCLGGSEQLRQVVTNLVSNAIHYNRPGGEVHVEVNSDGHMIVLTVRDTGKGIALEDLPHIFERFYRSDKARSRANGHVGLGLAITKAIVEAHGGTIHAASEIGHGSTFTVRLQSLRT